VKLPSMAIALPSFHQQVWMVLSQLT